MKVDKTFKDSCKLIIDTREKEISHIIDVLKKENINFSFEALPIGDYIIDFNGYRSPLVIERKASLNELIGNLLDNKKDDNGHNRFFRELERAKASNIQVVILLECDNYYLDILKHNYISKADTNAVKGLILSLEAKYPNVKIKNIDKKLTASLIYNTLYYSLREFIKNLEYH